MPGRKKDNKNNKLKLSLERMREIIQEINDLVSKKHDLDLQQSLEFCNNYLAVQRKINELSQSMFIPHRDLAAEAQKLLLSDQTRFFDSYPVNRIVFLEKLVLCHDRFPDHQGDLQLLAQICEAHLDYLLANRDEKKRYYPAVNIKIVFSILLFAAPNKARDYFFNMTKGQSFLLALIAKDCCSAFKLLLRLSDGASDIEKGTLLPYLSEALARVKQYVPADQMFPYWADYCKAYVAVPLSTVSSTKLLDKEDEDAGFSNVPLSTNITMLTCCLLEPGVIERVGSASIVDFLNNADEQARQDVLNPLLSAARTWLAENPASENTYNIAHQAMQATIRQLSSESLIASTAYPRLVTGLISVLAVKKPKPSRWTRFLIWLGWSKPTPTEFSNEQKQQLICCAPVGSAKVLLRDYYSELTAKAFLELINNPALCVDNRKVLLENFFGKGQSTLRDEVYQQLQKSEQKVSLTVVQQWLVPLGKSSETTQFLECAFDDHFQAECEELELSQLLSLRNIYMAHQVTGLPMLILTRCIAKITRKSIFEPVVLDNKWMSCFSGQEVVSNPTLLALYSYLVTVKGAPVSKGDSDSAVHSCLVTPASSISSTGSCYHAVPLGVPIVSAAHSIHAVPLSGTTAPTVSSLLSKTGWPPGQLLPPPAPLALGKTKPTHYSSHLSISASVT